MPSASRALASASSCWSSAWRRREDSDSRRDLVVLRALSSEDSCGLRDSSWDMRAAFAADDSASFSSVCLFVCVYY